MTGLLAGWLERVTYEIFPAVGVEQQVCVELPPGSRVAITHSPRQGLERSISIAVVLADGGFRPVVHLGAKNVPSAAVLAEAVATLRSAGVDDAFVVGGDGAAPLGPFRTARELLQALNSLGRPFTRVGVAGHPEGHPAAPVTALTEALRDKQRLGADYIATQMCFDASAWREWAEAIRTAGVTLPLSVGVPGVVARRKLLEVGIRAGAGPSLRAVRAQRGFARRMLGGAYAPEELLGELAVTAESRRLPIEALHMFTFNSMSATAAWVDVQRRNSAVDQRRGQLQ